MTTYQFRSSILKKEVSYGLNGQALILPDGHSLDFTDIKLVRVYKLRGAGVLSGTKRCVIRPAHGRPIVLVSVHFVSLGNFEDRSGQFKPFVDALIQQVAVANPNTIFVEGFPMALWWLWAAALTGAAIALPMAGMFSILMLVDSIIVTLVTAAATLAAIAFCLFYFLRSLAPDWPRRFDPRVVPEIDPRAL